MKYLVEIEWSDGVDSLGSEYVDGIRGVCDLLTKEQGYSDAGIADYECHPHMTVIRIAAEE